MQPGHKDYFSRQSKAYAAFRPTYPAGLYDFIFREMKVQEMAWDCGTGNGQVARHLSTYFKKVFATDISGQQLANAPRKENIEYSISSAEQTYFPSHQMDLITVAQAIHWFDLDKFYQEVRRVSKPDGLLAVWCYSLVSINSKVDAIIGDFYTNTVGPYWDAARLVVEDEYRTIPFPFAEIKTQPFTIDLDWTLDQLCGYISSWSATQKYREVKGVDPVVALRNMLENHWVPATTKAIQFPVFMRLGRIN